MPAAAVIRGVQALFGITGRKGSVGGESSRSYNTEANFGSANETGFLEWFRGKWNSWCSGGMRRDQEEHRWRRQLAGDLLTLRLESVGSKQD